MRIATMRTLKEILEKALEKDSIKPSTIYKVGDLVLNESSDSDILRIALERGLIAPRCGATEHGKGCIGCSEKLVPIFDFGGTLDSWQCKGRLI